METLCAFVRENAGPPEPPAEAVVSTLRKGPRSLTEEDRKELNNAAKSIPWTAVDVQAALTVIGRRSKAQRGYEREQGSKSSTARDAWRLNLTRCHLPRANLSGLDFRAARFSGSALPYAKCSNSHFEEASLDDVHFEGAELTGAHLERAWLHRAHLEGAWLNLAHLESANCLRPTSKARLCRKRFFALLSLRKRTLRMQTSLLRVSSARVLSAHFYLTRASTRLSQWTLMLMALICLRSVGSLRTKSTACGATRTPNFRQQ